MFAHLSDLAKGLIFYGIVCVLAIAFTFAPLDGESVARYSMFIPLFVVLLMLLVVTRDGHSQSGWASLGLHHAGFSGWPLAILVPLVVLGAAYGIVWATGFASYKDPAWMPPVGWSVSARASRQPRVCHVDVLAGRGNRVARLSAPQAWSGCWCCPSHGAHRTDARRVSPAADLADALLSPGWQSAHCHSAVPGRIYRRRSAVRVPSTHLQQHLAGQPGALDPQLALGSLRQPDRRDLASGGGVPGGRERHPHHHWLRHCRGVAVARLPMRRPLSVVSRWAMHSHPLPTDRTETVMWKVVTRRATTVAVLLVVLAAVGFGYERVMAARDAQSFPPTGPHGDGRRPACTWSAPAAVSQRW